MNKKLATLFGLTAVVFVLSFASGCARPNEWGYTVAYTDKERGDQILRNWDLEGKEMNDDIDEALLLRPADHLTIWSVQ
jgi:hypothetical protein